MDVKDAELILKYLISKQNLSLKELDLSDGLKIFEKFYRNYRFENCDITEDDDMLLYEWGSYTWSGNLFQISLGRQFIISDEEGDDWIKQLHLIFFYPVGTFEEGINGNQWFSNPNEADSIQKFIFDNKSFTELLNKIPVKVEIDYKGV